MIVVVNMKNVIQQGETYHFRIVVPMDCVEAVGKKEIVESLRTKNPLEAEERAEPLRKHWKNRFKGIRNPFPSDLLAEDDESAEEVVDYYQVYRRLMQKNLLRSFENKTLEEIRFSGEFFRDCASLVKEASLTRFEIPELDLAWPLLDEVTLGKGRRRNSALMKVLLEMSSVCFEELNEPVIEVINPAVVKVETSEEIRIVKVSQQLLASKKRSVKTIKKIEAEVSVFVEWNRGNVNITSYTKDDLIDYICNCLPQDARCGERWNISGSIDFQDPIIGFRTVCK